MSFQEYQGYIAVLGTIVGAIMAVGTLITRRLSKQDEEILKLRLELIEESKKRLIHETQFNMFWEYYKQEVPKMLTHPHTPELDELHKIWEQRELTLEEKREYVRLAGEIIDRNYDLPYVADKVGIYAAMRSQFRKDLKMPEEVKKINEHYDEQKRKLLEEYERKKSRKWKKFW